LALAPAVWKWMQITTIVDPDTDVHDGDVTVPAWNTPVAPRTPATLRVISSPLAASIAADAAEEQC
jgi:hypothetical protein